MSWNPFRRRGPSNADVERQNREMAEANPTLPGDPGYRPPSRYQVPLPGGGFGGPQMPGGGAPNPMSMGGGPASGGGQDWRQGVGPQGGLDLSSTGGAGGIGSIADRLGGAAGSIFGGAQDAAGWAGGKLGGLVDWENMKPEHKAFLLSQALGSGVNIYANRQEGKRRDREDDERREKEEARKERNKRMTEAMAPMFRDYVNRGNE